MQVRKAARHLAWGQELDLHAQAALQGHVALGLRQLAFGRDQDQVAVLAERRVDAELDLEALEGLDAGKRELDADAVGVLVADPSAGQGRRPGADVVALEHDHAASPAPGQVIGRADAHDAGADHHNVRARAHWDRAVLVVSGSLRAEAR